MAVLLVLLIGRLFLPFARPLAWAAILAIITVPVFRRVLAFTGGRRTLSALIVSLLVVVAVAGPATLFAVAVAREAGAAYDMLHGSSGGGTLHGLQERLVRLPRAVLPAAVGEDTIRRAEAWAARVVPETAAIVTSRLGGAFASAVGHLAEAVLKLVLIFLAMFFFLRDGPAWLGWLGSVTPLAPGVRDAILIRVRDATRAVFQGMMLTAAAQGALLGIGFAIFGIPFPVFFSLLGFLAALLPVAGAAAVWLPAGGWLVATGETGRGLGLLIVGACVVPVLDNVLRPWLIGTRVKLPVLVLLLSILGGLMAVGMIGMFLGPVVISMAAAVGNYSRGSSAAPARIRATKAR